MWSKIYNAWKDLSQPIYTGEHLKENLNALTAVSLFTALLGAVLTILDLVTGQTAMLIPADSFSCPDSFYCRRL